jgi:uncharacterized protein
MPIAASMLWRRLDAPGHDACRLERRGRKWLLSGVAAFRHSRGPASVEYSLLVDDAWRTLQGRVKGAVGVRRIDIRASRQDDGWLVDGARVDDLTPLSDLDFGFTPATNFVQLKRVELPLGVSTPLPVAWLDLDSGGLSALEQTYQRLSEAELLYTAPAFGYRAILKIAPNGFIQTYPGLWEADLA